jgi:Cell wall-associated hydrolases (invasion-associated proteins)
MRKLLKISLVCAAGLMVFTANPKTALAYEEGVAGFVYDKDSSNADDKSGSTKLVSMTDSELPIPGYNNLAIANVDTNLLIRSGPGEDKKILGKLPKNGGCEVLEESKDGWTKISADTTNDSIVGYVNSDFLITGDEALRKAKEVGNYVAKAITEGLNIRDKASTDAEVIDQMAKGEELIVLDSKVSTDDSEHSDWVKVAVDSDDADNDSAYVAKEYVSITFQLIHAVSIQEIQYGSGVSSARVSLVNLAKDHLGEAYRWGGTRLGVGVDCSGFTQALYRKMGYSIPRDSRSQAAAGHRISASELKPGDLVFYGSSRYINHVAMYIGGGRIIHASNRIDGIKISNMYYRSPVKFARFIK